MNKKPNAILLVTAVCTKIINVCDSQDGLSLLQSMPFTIWTFF